MTATSQGLRLNTLGVLLVAACFLTAYATAWMWSSSTNGWRDHLTRSYVAGVSLYDSLRTRADPPVGVDISPLSQVAQTQVMQGDFWHLPNVPQPAFVTNVSIKGQGHDPVSGESLALIIVSDSLQYNVSELISNGRQSAAQKLGNVTQLLATYCSEPILFARMGAQDWKRIDGQDVWGCHAAPTDLRLPAILLALVALAVFTTLVRDTSAHFERFARTLRNHRRLGGPQSYALQGPEELREIVQALNRYLEREREQIAKRATVLSGVSHDLGTPATRLRLRAALVEDAELRGKFEADIDSMTEMIESVLTYTRAELNEEPPRNLSLTSLIDALVDDYQDLGQPVTLETSETPSFQGGGSVFTATAGRGALPTEQRILVSARPVSLKRAISNLIENALKYGRKAKVAIEATAEHAIITVEDEGSGMTAAEIEAAVAPFTRGDNTQAIDGYGLGLTIVATVAEQHGGTLYFEAGTGGMRACLKIQRH
ncbi:sensor histidine kinase [Shimia sp.]|uniref:sensor histidine kinase n=1 Tax=unclassified Shimia TaxID=2630038 RepID=UPI0025ED811B|nr:HAMP domain-containing sensor histidine kinase [Shimia sp.]MCH2068627.1 HAMP domain-containing histidine kinase [Shimia sp.]